MIYLNMSYLYYLFLLILKKNWRFLICDILILIILFNSGNQCNKILILKKSCAQSHIWEQEWT